MQISGTLSVFRDAPPDELAVLGIFHALQALSVALVDDEVRRHKVEVVLDAFVERALQAGLSEEQLDHYLVALHSITGQD